MLMEGLGRIPRHCRCCGKRFYVDAARFGLSQGAPEDSESAEKKEADA
jgi:hypothetical protein